MRCGGCGHVPGPTWTFGGGWSYAGCLLDAGRVLAVCFCVRAVGHDLVLNFGCVIGCVNLVMSWPF